MCTIYSDRHYHTFDGLEYDYHTDCQVYLLKVSLLFINPVGLLHASVIMLAVDATLTQVFMNDSTTEEWSVGLLASKAQYCSNTKRPVFTSNPKAPTLPGI